MKRKLLLAFIVIAILACVFAVSASASVIFEDEDGNELLSYELVNSIITGETGVGFAKTDSDEDALTWYITATETVGSDTVNTVASIKTKECVTISNNVLSIKSSVVKNESIVSINLDVGGYTTISGIFNSQKFQNCNVMYAYVPKYVTVFQERMFRGAEKLILLDIPYDSELTDYGTFVLWGATNIREFYVPKYVTGFDYGAGTPTGKDNSSGQSYFSDCKALKTVYFHPDNVITELKNAPFKGAPALEEIRFGNNLKFLGDRSFRACSRLKRVYFGDSFEGFYSVYMFYECKALEDLYIPATVTQNTTGLTYQWSRIFDSSCSSTFRINFTGTEEQFIAFYNVLVSAGSNDRIKNMVTNGVINTERVKFTTDCIAFYNGEHDLIGNNCERCGKLVYCDDVTHNLDVNITYDSYTSNGVKTIVCLDCQTEAKKSVTAPLFICLGYSAYESGNGITISFIMNNDAIAEYEQITKRTIEYGVFAVSANNIGSNDVFNENGDKASGVISASLSNYNFIKFDLKIVGFKDDQKALKLAMGAYVLDNGKYSYLQEGTPNKGEKYCFTTYNSIVGEVV